MSNPGNVESGAEGPEDFHVSLPTTKPLRSRPIMIERVNAGGTLVLTNLSAGRVQCE